MGGLEKRVGDGARRLDFSAQNEPSLTARRWHYNLARLTLATSAQQCREAKKCNLDGRKTHSTHFHRVCVAVRARFSRINMRFFTDFYVFLFNLVDTSGFEMC